MRVGIDVGGTKTHGVVVDDSLRVLAELQVPSGRGASGVLESARTMIRSLEGQLGVPRGSFESLGIGIPGKVDFEAGTVAHAVNLELESLDLAGGLAGEVIGAVRIDNDVNAAALGARGMLDPVPETMAFLNVGTGLAAGLVWRGAVLRGSSGVAGEIGHIPVDANGVRCACGQIGCLETVASGGAVMTAWPTPGGRALGSVLDAAAAGDLRAHLVLKQLAGGIATAVQLLVLTLDPEIVVLGGGVLDERARLMPIVDAEFAARAATSRFLHAIDMPARIRMLPIGTPVSAVGAALLPTTESPTAAHPASHALRARDAV
jgi:glucokinase